MGKIMYAIEEVAKGLAALKIHERVIMLQKPDSVEFTKNEVVAHYGSFTQTITAEGSGNERHNFNSVITKT